MINSRIKKFLGWGSIVLLCIIPAFLWLFLGSRTAIPATHESITRTFGALFGLIGMTLFAFVFLLSAKISFIEYIFGGKSKTYNANGVLGIIASVFILFHPLLLALKFLPQNITKTIDYLMPGNYWSINFGILATFGILLLLTITLCTRIDYRRWKYSEEFLGLLFIAAALHIFLVRSATQDNIFDGYFIYAAAVSCVGIAGLIHSLYHRKEYPADEQELSPLQSRAMKQAVKMKE